MHLTVLNTIEVSAGRNSPRPALQIAALDLLSIELLVLQLHVLVHGTFGAIAFMTSLDRACVMPLDFSRSSSVTFSFVIKQRVRAPFVAQALNP